MTTLEKYQIEAEEDLKVDEVSIQEKCLMVPTIKHKWVSRIIKSKKDLIELEELKKKSVKLIVEKMKETQKVTLSDATLSNSAYKHETVVKISNKIEETKILIDYLERLEKILTSMTWDYKNMIELIKLETM